MICADKERSCELSNGDILTVKILEPPLGKYVDCIWYTWRDVRQQLMVGELVETSVDRFIIGDLNGEYVGSMTYSTPRDTRDLAVLGMVWTRPDQRRKGIATVLLQLTLADFRAQGGIAAYLCTTNPTAFHLYYKQGFRPHIGDGMRYLSPGHEDFDQTYFSYAGPARVRAGTWGDLARVSALYNQPQPDWVIKDYHRRVFRDVRYESHYIRVWKPANEGHGTLLVLENGMNRVVGLASLVEVDSFYEQHAQILDFWACPAYLEQLRELLSAAVDRAGSKNAEIIQAHVAEADVDRQRLLSSLGFSEESRLRERLRVNGQYMDLITYGRSTQRRVALAHPPSAYYGGRRVYGQLPTDTSQS